MTDNQSNKQRSLQDNGGLAYTIDVVFCIDATGSMEDLTGSQMKIINMVKQKALSFYTDLSEGLAAESKIVRQLRVRVVAFRDYIADGQEAMMVTDFFLLPQQEKEFEACVNSITADGGGDPPEDGLEALAYAIRSDWAQDAAKKRHIIVVWTDAGTHALGHAKNSPHYPKGMAQTMAELNDWWDSMSFNAKRLIMFAPNENYWNYISGNWENVIHYPSVAGNGLAETTYGEILDAITNSV